MNTAGYVIETVEEVELDINLEESSVEDYENFGSFEIDPNPDEDIYIPGTDEKIN